MTRLLCAIVLLTYQSAAHADIFAVFRHDDGSTNWQYIANTSASLLILSLLYIVTRLYLSHRASLRHNLELQAVRDQLEHRVKERTATLNESNRLLQEGNRALEDEIAEHRVTTQLLRTSESYINNILRSLPIMLIGLGHRGNITQWNRKAEEISGLKSSDVVGKNLWQAYPSITITEKQVAQARSSRQPTIIKQSQRGQYHFDITIYPLENQSETDVVVLLADVTQRIIAENMLIQRDKMSSMGELAASMALDINGPLQGVMARIRDYLARHPEQADDHDLNDALNRGEQTSAVINNLLNFSRARGGEKRSASLPSLLDHSVELASELLSVPAGLNFKDITVTRNYAQNTPDIACYVTELQQVFLSLFRHSLQAMSAVSRPDYQPTLSLSVDTTYDALWIKVHHNGQSMSPEEQQFLFEPFLADPPVSREPRHGDDDAGKRLSFSYFIITEQHDGQLAVTSDDSGTTFHIELRLTP